MKYTNYLNAVLVDRVRNQIILKTFDRPDLIGGRSVF